jgi:hypothetical protein
VRKLFKFDVAADQQAVRAFRAQEVLESVVELNIYASVVECVEVVFEEGFVEALENER